MIPASAIPSQSAAASSAASSSGNPANLGPFTTTFDSSDLTDNIIKGFRKEGIAGSHDRVKATVTQHTNPETGQPYVHIEIEQVIKVAGINVTITESGYAPGAHLEPLPGGGVNIVSPQIKPKSHSLLLHQNEAGGVQFFKHKSVKVVYR